VNDTRERRPAAALAGLRFERWGELARGLGWRRAMLVRRALAALLVLAALVLAIRAPSVASSTTPVVVAVRELAPGSTIRAADIQVRQWPPELVPAGALTTPTEADGRVLAGAANAGEPLTSVRLAGPELAKRASPGYDAVGVPIRLADADVAALLAPGRLVDVVTAGARSDQPTVLASAAVVLTVLPPDAKTGGRGRLALVSVPRAVATKLAAATLSQDVTITLR
jgi:pilus assembly protein CpaB